MLDDSVIVIPMKVLVFLAGHEQQKAALRLLAISKLINQAVGDALSGMLLVEAILRHMGWSIKRWSELYQDLPSKQLKVESVSAFNGCLFVLYLELFCFLVLYIILYNYVILIVQSNFSICQWFYFSQN